MRHAIASISGGMLLGAGLGGIVEGLLFRGIVRWPDLVAARVLPDLYVLQTRIVWDGWFFGLCMLLGLIGVGLLWLGGQRSFATVSMRAFGGAMMVGWGLLNVAIGVFDHPILGLHHVHTGAGQIAWDVGFFLIGAIQVIGGAALLDLRQPRRVTQRVIRPVLAHG